MRQPEEHQHENNRSVSTDGAGVAASNTPVAVATLASPTRTQEGSGMASWRLGDPAERVSRSVGMP
jgi:hypothetical protein